jgi:hypothetical protein
MLRQNREIVTGYTTFEFDLADMKPFFKGELLDLIERCLAAPPRHVDYPVSFDLNASWGDHYDLDCLKIWGSSVEDSRDYHILKGYSYDDEKYPGLDGFEKAHAAGDIKHVSLTSFLESLLPEEFRDRQYSIIIRKKFTEDRFPHPIFLFEEKMNHPIFTKENVESGEFEPSSYDDWDYENFRYYGS